MCDGRFTYPAAQLPNFHHVRGLYRPGCCEALDAIVPQDIQTWVPQAHDLSRRQRREGVPMGERRPQLLDALNDLYGHRERSARVSS